MFWLVPILFGASVALIVLAAASFNEGSPAREKLARLAGTQADRKKLGESLPERTRGLLVRVLTAAAPRAVRSGGPVKSELRSRLVHAGYRNPSAPILFLGARTALAAATLVLVLGSPLAWKLEERQLFLFAAGGAALAFVAPGWWLDQRRKRRQLQIQRGLPDALDLMVVCVEAGLGINASLARVAQEFARANPVLSDEFALVSSEIRAGKSTIAAMRALAARTGVAELQSFVSMLTQTERFGTSVAQALRVHAESMRTARLLRAEEAAAKAPVKMLFPAALFIFPATLMVTIGPGLMKLFSFFASKE